MSGNGYRGAPALLSLLALPCLQACRKPEPVLLGNAAAEFFAPAGALARFAKVEVVLYPKQETFESADEAKVAAVIARLRRMHSDAAVDVTMKWEYTGRLTLTRNDGQVLELGLMNVPDRLAVKLEYDYYSDEWSLGDWCDAIR